MAFVISKAHHQPSFSPESDLQNQNNSKDGEAQAQHHQSVSVTSHLYLKSSSNSKAAALDRDLVLRRIRHHKDMRKVKSAFQALMGNRSSSSELQATSTTDMASWLDQENSFSP
ncbi:hypothetical protein M0R45_004313 [Rubus argutus]|uniref:Uncharacterized protein n=1 Tax=Rubus argutus TaxID=59490 RepID=A0AAW1YJG9_RUBAR